MPIVSEKETRSGSSGAIVKFLSQSTFRIILELAVGLFLCAVAGEMIARGWRWHGDWGIIVGIVLFWGAMDMVFMGLPLLLVQGWIVHRYKKGRTTYDPLHLVIFLPVIFPATCHISSSIHHARPSSIFRRLVADPIPPGVRNIHVDGWSGGFTGSYLIRFESEPEEMGQILVQKKFLPVDESDQKRVIAECSEFFRSYDPSFLSDPEWHYVHEPGNWIYLVTNSKQDKAYLVYWY
ncbi:MAG: hypothetical protein V1809_06465 [Planctomycetota bacterium]